MFVPATIRIMRVRGIPSLRPRRALAHMTKPSPQSPSSPKGRLAVLIEAFNGKRLALGFAITLAAVLLATRVDRQLFHWASGFALRSEDALGHFYALAEPFGWFSTWLVIAILFFLFDRRRPGRAFRRTGLILWPIVWAGIGTYLLKILIRRARPRDHDGEYWFRPLTEDLFSSSGLGMPSGDASIAFAGLFILYRLMPRAWPIWFTLGYGCALHRMLLGAHFLSDVILAFALGVLCASAIWALYRNKYPEDTEPSVTQPHGVSAGVGALWLALFAGSIALVSELKDWRPATPADLPGIYGLDQRTWPKHHIVFAPDGTYDRATVISGLKDGSPRIERTVGSWSIGSDGFRLDGQTAEVHRADSALRLIEGEAVSIFKRISRWHGPGRPSD